MRKLKSLAKEALKSMAPAVDRVFLNKNLRKTSIKVANIFINRYARYGENIEVAIPRNYSGDWQFVLDTPKITKSSKRKVYVSGWLMPLRSVKTVSLRITSPAKKVSGLVYGLDRSDVAGVMSAKYKKDFAPGCGFGSTIEIDEDGMYLIEVKLGSGKWEKLTIVEMAYDPDYLASDTFNPSWNVNMSQHLNLMENKKKYFYEAEKVSSFELSDKDTKLITFYLPQFHPFKENDEWWGKGFTEWTNVTSAQPRFVGHEQPKLPADLGFYDLRYEDNIKRQIDMAKKHGIYGFCLYYYWFSGKHLMDGPVESIVKHKEWDFNFMICWANENWTRRWDGRQDDVLIAQEHKPNDALKFIQDVEHILLDPRYIRIDGKPTLMVYRAHDLGIPKEYSEVWRNYFKNKHGLDLHLVCVQSFRTDKAEKYGFDKAVEFVPLSIADKLKRPVPAFNISDKFIDMRFNGGVFDYRQSALEVAKKGPTKNVYPTVMPSWDNDARKKGSGGVFYNSNPDIYAHWLDKTIKDSKSNQASSEDNFVFVNAWNEWAEGAYLEPDTMYGHAFLNRTSEILAKHSDKSENQERFPAYGITKRSTTKLVVIIHLYYKDIWTSFEKNLKRLEGTEYDLFVTIPEKHLPFVDQIKLFRPDAIIEVVPNRGRDVLPFVHYARRLREAGYEYFLKMHSKKSSHRHDGHLWMDDMLASLIPKDQGSLDQLLDVLKKKDTGIVGPEGHYVSMTSFFGSNRENITRNLEDIVGMEVADKTLKNLDAYGFFAGTMFWGRFDAIDEILDMYFQTSDFEAEATQIDGTFAHSLERLFCVIPQIRKRKMYSFNGTEPKQMIREKSAAETYTYAKNE